MKKNDLYYKAMLARDARFDGKFFIGVKTTGIYCRPICPAKPLQKNVEFFATYLEAEKAGYRPCLRCRPESAPGSPVWIGKTSMVKRGIRIIQNHEALKFNEEDFALRFGVSARHLRRVFKEEIGLTPKQLAFLNRLNLSRQLVVETSLPFTEVAYSSGFESIRRFNDAFKKRFKKSPTELRNRIVQEDGPLILSVSYRPPYDFKGLIDVYRSHRIEHLEKIDENSYVRQIEHEGKTGFIKVTNNPLRSCLDVEINFPDNSIIYSIISRVKSMFDVNSDPVLIETILNTDEQIKKLLKKYPGIRIPTGWDPFETAVATILGQFVSVEHGRKLVGDLITIVGKKCGDRLLFPSPQDILDADLSNLRTTKARKVLLRDFSMAIINRVITLEETQDPEAFRKALLSLKGIGPWSADYMSLKVLKNADAFPETDLILKRALTIHKKEKIDALSPWRGQVATLLWREYYKKLN